MDIHSIKKYYTEVDKIIQFGGSKKENSIRNAFYMLLNEYARQKDLVLVPEVTIRTKEGKNVTPDGTLKDMLRQDWGYWESKDESDILDDEISKKFSKGYPKDNILFEDSQQAVLIQDGAEVMWIDMKDMQALDRILKEFVNFERPEVKNFRTVIELFKQDIPKVTAIIRDIIIEQGKTNAKFIEIVKFIIESTDYLLYQHFGKLLDDRNVEILDPATGTGTFICDIIDHISDKEKLQYKYDHEIHANEVAILPYYIANLNIEYTYKQKTGEYREFKNLIENFH